MADDEDPPERLPFAPSPLPRHIAIIMDGNGRWAKARGKPRAMGHEAGVRAIKGIVQACGDWGVEALTVYAFSTENWNRPRLEVEALMRLLRSYLCKETQELHENNVRLRTIGDIDRLPKIVRKELDHSIDFLSNNTGLVLNLALSYGSRDEIVRGIRALALQVAAGTLEPDAIDEAMLSQQLDTAGLPEPDLIIRTGGEMRLSNFLLWQASYAEFYSTELCWPDFDRDALAEAIRVFQGRTRRFGKVLED